MSDPADLAASIHHLAEALEQLSVSTAPAAQTHPDTSSPRGSVASWVEVVGPSPGEPGSRVASEPASLHHSSLSASALSARYDELEAAFPTVPHRCVQACRSLSGSGSSSTERATRAWKAGQWVRAVLEDRVPKPRPSSRLPSTIRSRIYVVIRANGLVKPLRCSTAKDFHKLVGPLSGSDALCHAFASIAEAAIYCEAAGFDLPDSEQ